MATLGLVIALNGVGILLDRNGLIDRRCRLIWDMVIVWDTIIIMGSMMMVDTIRNMHTITTAIDIIDYY